MIIVLYFMFYRYKYRVLNVRQMIYDQHSSYVGIPDFLSCPYCLKYHLWPSFFMFVFSRVQYSVLIVRHFICEHRCFCLCHLEINSVPRMFDISSILIVVCDCFFNSSPPYHIVRHIIHDHTSLCLCFPELNIVSLLFDT